MDSVNAALDTLLGLVRGAPGIALAALLGALLLILLLLVTIVIRQSLLARRQSRLLRGVDGANLERLLLDHADEMQGLRSLVEGTRSSGQTNADSLLQCLQRIAIVRYDAFADSGGRQSFSLAMLDAGSNGMVVSALHSRHDMRVYAKPVLAGASPLALTVEEKQAIAAATAGGPTLIENDINSASGGGTSSRGGRTNAGMKLSA